MSGNAVTGKASDGGHRTDDIGRHGDDLTVTLRVVEPDNVGGHVPDALHTVVEHHVHLVGVRAVHPHDRPDRHAIQGRRPAPAGRRNGRRGDRWHLGNRIEH